MIPDAFSIDPFQATNSWPVAALATAKAPIRSAPEVNSSGTRSGAQPWIEAFRDSLASIRHLKAGWAGPGSKAVEPSMYYVAEHYLALALASVPNPQLPYVVPSANGGLQIEWHRESVELEVLFSPGGQITALLEVPAQELEIEEAGHAAVNLLLRWAPRAAKTGDDVVVTADSPPTPALTLAA